MGATGTIAAGIVLDGAQKVASILKTLSETLRQNNPDVSAARAQVGELQQAIYELQMENLGLKGQIVQLESDKSDLKDKVRSDTDWQTRIAGLVLFETPGGATVYARNGQPPYFCPPCLDKHSLNPLQRRSSSGGCPGCKHIYELERYTSDVSVLQRRKPPRNQGIHF